MTKWEYRIFSKTLTLKEDDNAGEIMIFHLNLIGQEGWEIVKIMNWETNRYRSFDTIDEIIASYTVFTKRERE